MLEIEKFLENYVPDNHWLSKSMELAKIEGTGTHWHLKKMMVYYYYIFILKKLEIKEIKEIVDIFDNYIQSISKESQEKAKNFFYKVDIRNIATVIPLKDFSYIKGFSKDQEKFELIARKFYYCYLMEIEQQNPQKKLIFEKTIKARNFYDGLQEAITELGEVTVEKQKRDVFAALRNERQILYILGLLNYTEISNIEEYTPTTAGKYVIYSNYNELILLMEIQKIKQVSRNPLVYYAFALNRTRNRQMRVDADKSIYKKAILNTTPYLMLLLYLLEKKELSGKVYRYLLARTTDNHSRESIIKFNLAEIKKLEIKVNEKDAKFMLPGSSNNSSIIIGGEDFSKELKKYILGIFSLKEESNDNLFYVGEYKEKNTTYEVNDLEKLNKIINGYWQINNYLKEKDKDLYNRISEDHKKKYWSHINKQKFNKKNLNHLNLIEDWLEYFVSIDINIIKLMLKTISDANSLSNSKILEYFPNITKKILGITNQKQAIKMFELNKEEDDDNQILDIPIVVPNVITENHLKIESEKYLNIKNDFRENRTRNKELIKKYLEWKSCNNSITCEACGDILIMNKSGKRICNVHHIIPFNEDGALGPDHYKNLIAVCPNCHSKFHTNIEAEEKKKLYASIEQFSTLKMGINQRIIDMQLENYLFVTSIKYAYVKEMISKKEYEKIMKSNI